MCFCWQAPDEVENSSGVYGDRRNERVASFTVRLPPAIGAVASSSAIRGTALPGEL